MDNRRFYEHRKFSKKKSTGRSKNKSSFQTNKISYGVDNLLSDIGNQEVANYRLNL